MASIANAQTEDANRALAVKISASGTSFPVGARIGVNLDVTNSAATRVRILTEPEIGGFEFIVRRVGAGLPSQPKMTSHRWAARGGTDPIQSVSGGNPRAEVLVGHGGPHPYQFIDPQMTVRITTVLNDLFDIRETGIYTIQVKKWRTAPSTNPKFAQPLDPVPAPVESNIITIIVTDPPPATISMQLTTSAQSFSAGSEIDGDLSVTNISSAAVSLPLNAADLAPEQNGFKFLGLTSRNAVVGRLVNYDWKPYDWKYGKEVEVAPGQTIHYPVRLSHVLDLSKPGSYTIKTETLDPATHNKVESSPLKIMMH